MVYGLRHKAMIEHINTIQTEATAAIAAAADEKNLEDLRIAYLGKKGQLTQAAAGMKNCPPAEKPALGQALNQARQAITQSLELKKTQLQEEADKKSVQGLDITLPARELAQGGLHPITQVKDRAIQILRRMGFSLADAQEIETEFHCFDALNTPADHPARNEKDTFYFDSGKLLRTHTSSVQIRTMEQKGKQNKKGKNKNEAPTLPVRIIAPGSAYRRDDVDATHLPVFTQLEGLFVAEDVKLGDLKGTLEYFLKAMFGESTEVRFRPHFFPFTEPSFEIDVKLHAKGQEPKWIEIAGCGMVDPAVFEAICDSRGDRVFDPEKVTGFAFGMGIDRLTMIQAQMKDIRPLIENDIRFLSQFV